MSQGASQPVNYRDPDTTNETFDNKQISGQNFCEVVNFNVMSQMCQWFTAVKEKCGFGLKARSHGAAAVPQGFLPQPLPHRMGLEPIYLRHRCCTV